MPTISQQPRAIFVARTPRFNVSSAEEFGDITYVFDAERTPSPLNTDEIINKILDELSSMNYNPTVDFIALTGPSLLVALFLTCAMHDAGSQPVKTLMFDARYDKYIERIVTMPS